MLLTSHGSWKRWILPAALACSILAPWGDRPVAEEPAGAAERQAPAVDWVQGPATGKLGDIADITIPAGFRFTGGAGTRSLLEFMENPTNGTELGMLVPDQAENDAFWFVVFEFDDIGYVKDDEKASLDADTILKSLKEGNEESNKVRKERGWGTVDLEGWEKQPFYNEATNNLEWATRATSEGTVSINYSTRVLGRKGVMRCDLVMGPGGLAAIAPKYQELLAGMSFSQGERYADFRSGDKIAAYGLTALIAGGLGAAALKSGLLAKFWKVIVVAVVAAASAVRKAVGALFGRKTPPPPEPTAIT
jgi:uncharacterized membrane-anchored protein